MHTPSNCLAGQGPTINKPRRRPNMRGATRQVEDDDYTEEHPAMELLSEVIRQLLPTVAPQPRMADPTANNSVDNGNNDNLGENSGENNIVSNNDNNIVGESEVELPAENGVDTAIS